MFNLKKEATKSAGWSERDRLDLFADIAGRLRSKADKLRAWSDGLGVISLPLAS